MIELAKAFAHIATMIETELYFKMKCLRYYDAMLYLYKNKGNKLPSITSTENLGTTNWSDTERNMDSLDHLKTEKDWIKHLKGVYEYSASPTDISKCSLSI